MVDKEGDFSQILSKLLVILFLFFVFFFCVLVNKLLKKLANLENLGQAQVSNGLDRRFEGALNRLSELLKSLAELEFWLYTHTHTHFLLGRAFDAIIQTIGPLMFAEKAINGRSQLFG